MRSDAGGEPAVVVRDLSKKYKIYPTSFARIKEALSLGKKCFHTPVWALRDVSLEVPRGRALGLIGANGAGKSTLLKILAGTTLPTVGSFEIKGKVASLLELGTGFHTEFTGRMNIYLSGAVQGFSRREIDRKIDSILEFAELGDFIDQPLRTYSSGMVMRLGFSMATAIDPDVLIIDEILAVGDLHFQKKCVDRIFNFKREGKSILFCSHSLYDVRQVCDEVVWFHEGRVRERGDPLEVTNNYANFERNLLTNEEAHVKGLEVLHGEEQPVIRKIVFVGAEGTSNPAAVHTGEDLAVQIDFCIRKSGQGVNVGAAIFRTDNVLVATFSSLLDGLDPFWEPGEHRIRLLLPDFRIAEGEYNLVGYLFDENGIHVYDHRQTDRNLVVVQEENRPGIVSLYHRWER